MNEKNKKMELLGSTPVPRALLALGFPTMIGMMINALYNLVDAYFVGGLGTSQMGAITIAYPLGQVVVGLGLLFGNGAASYLSRLLGRGDKKTADQAASTALYSSISVGAAVILCSLLFLHPLLRQLGATESIMPYAITYTGIYIASSIFNVFNVTMNNIISSEGAAKTTMCVLITGAVLNVILDPIFIYTLNLGVAGAAIATAISGKTAERFGAIRLAIACCVALGAGLIAYGLSGNVMIAITLAMCLSVASSLFHPSTIALGMDYVPLHLGMASGLSYGVTVCIGGVVEPLLGMAGDAVGLTPVFFIMAGVAFAAALLACVLKRHDALRLPM